MLNVSLACHPPFSILHLHRIPPLPPQKGEQRRAKADLRAFSSERFRTTTEPLRIYGVILPSVALKTSLCRQLNPKVPNYRAIRPTRRPRPFGRFGGFELLAKAAETGKYRQPRRQRTTDDPRLTPFFYLSKINQSHFLSALRAWLVAPKLQASADALILPPRQAHTLAYKIPMSNLSRWIRYLPWAYPITASNIGLSRVGRPGALTSGMLRCEAGVFGFLARLWRDGASPEGPCPQRPVTEPKRSQNPKGPLVRSFSRLTTDHWQLTNHATRLNCQRATNVTPSCRAEALRRRPTPAAVDRQPPTIGILAHLLQKSNLSPSYS